MHHAQVAAGDAHAEGWSFTRVRTWYTGGQGRPVAILAAILLALAYARWGEIHWQTVRYRVFDTYQSLFPRQIEHWPVVIIDIDEAGLAQFGQWPWPRALLGQLIAQTHQLGALAIGLDMIMPEAERQDVSSAFPHALTPSPTNDGQLAAVLQRTPSVVGRAATRESQPAHVALDEQTPVRLVGEVVPGVLQLYHGHVTNIPLLEHAAPGHGYLNTEPDGDGVVRAMPVILPLAGAPGPTLAPALTLELLRLAFKESAYSVYADPQGLRQIRIGTHVIATDADGRLRLHYARPDPRRHVSALAVLQGTVAPEMIRQKVALIGVTALGLADVVTTPGGARIDGVEVQAQALEHLLYSGIRLVRPASLPWWELGTFLLAAAALILGFPRLRPGLGVGLFLLLSVVLLLTGAGLFVWRRLLYDPSVSMGGQTVVFVVLLTSGLAASQQRRRELRAALDEERLHRSRLEGELQAARAIQMGMLPAPWAITGLPEHLAFHALLEPARAVGGDLYDAFMLDADHFFFLVGDVSGKGVPASLFMALSKTLCKSLALRSHLPLDALMTAVNQEISRDNTQSLFVTAIAGILDIRTGIVELCSAGHEAPILLRRGASPCVLTVDGGPPLCVLEDFCYPSSVVQLQSEDLLLLLTDGIVEAHDPAQRLYGAARVLDYCQRLQEAQEAHEPYNVLGVCQGLYNAVKDFRREAEQSDDITIMALRFTIPGNG